MLAGKQKQIHPYFRGHAEHDSVRAYQAYQGVFDHSRNRWSILSGKHPHLKKFGCHRRTLLIFGDGTILKYLSYLDSSIHHVDSFSAHLLELIIFYIDVIWTFWFQHRLLLCKITDIDLCSFNFFSHIFSIRNAAGKLRGYNDGVLREDTTYSIGTVMWFFWFWVRPLKINMSYSYIKHKLYLILFHGRHLIVL